MHLSPSARLVIATRAATIDERRQTRGDDGGVPADAADRMARWQQAFAPNDPAAFARRLSWDGLDPASAARVVSPDFERTLNVATDWIIWIDRLCAEADDVLADFRAGRRLDRERSDTGRPFDAVWEPARRAARRELMARLPHGSADVVDPAVFQAFDEQLAHEIGRYGDLAMFESFRTHIAPTTPAGPDTPDRTTPYVSFVEAMLDGGLIDFLIRYAALARQLAMVMELWTAATAEFVVRLDTDRGILAGTFGGGTDPGPLVAIRLALSDPHNGRRRVHALTFASGLRVVYKPRSVRIEQVFGDLVHWLNTGLDHALPAPVACDRGAYGWVAYAAHARRASRAEAAVYFQQAGALMCVTAALGARDLHRENVVATSDGPVLVDLELLLQPDTQTAARGHGHDGVASSSAWCLATGLLSLVDLTPDGDPHDAGGLRGATTGTLPFATRVWKACGTADLRVEEVSTFATTGTHQVIVGDDVQRPGAYVGALVAGFSQAYRLLLLRRDDLLAPGGPLAALAACHVRVLPRPTNQYAMLAHLLATPKYQGDGVTASAAVDVLHRGYARSVERPALWPVAVEERRALLALDVPYFTVEADGIDGMAGDRILARGFFARSGLGAAANRLHAMSFADLAAQIAILRRALSESVESRYDACGAVPSSPAAGSSEPGEAALWVARVLLARAERITGGGLVWRYRPIVGGPGWRDHHLYDGSLGPALFLAALARATGDVEWADAARDARAPLRAHAVRHGATSWPGESFGGGNGLGAIVYGTTLLAALTGEDDWLEIATSLAVALPARLAVDRPVDVIDGSAGAVLALLALYDVTSDDRVLDRAVACGRQIVARQRDGAWPSDDGVRLLGFAHGAAGMAAALARLAAVTGEPAFAHRARQAFGFVRRQYLASAANWPIATTGDGAAVGGVMHGWCHGAPGIVLASLSAAAIRPSAALTAGIESGARAIAGWQPAQADHVCCGTLGRAEVLLNVAAQTGRGEAIDAARALAQRVVQRARRRGHFRLSGVGTDYRVFDPGFFQGLSGIGYTLLRVAAPATLPSIAAFDPPRATLRYCSTGVHGTGHRAHRPAALSPATVGTECTS